MVCLFFSDARALWLTRLKRLQISRTTRFLHFSATTGSPMRSFPPCVTPDFLLYFAVKPLLLPCRPDPQSPYFFVHLLHGGRRPKVESRVGGTRGLQRAVRCTCNGPREEAAAAGGQPLPSSHHPRCALESQPIGRSESVDSTPLLTARHVKLEFHMDFGSF